MFPSKSMVDYMSEMNRLFPRPESENAYSLAAQSPLNSTINRSSSSTDSTSPESFPDISMFRPDLSYQPMPDTSRPIFDTPPPVLNPQRIRQDTPRSSDAQCYIRRQRPIVGRKILTTENPSHYERVQASPIQNVPEDFEFHNALWQDDPVLFQHTPPNVNNILIEHKNVTNVFYELFPTETKEYEFKTPVNTSPTLSNISNVSPTLSNVSMSSTNQSPMRLTPQTQFQRSPPQTQYHRSPLSGSNFGPGSSRFQVQGQKMCKFCKKNGETPIVFMTHSVKERVGNKYVVSCPILRSHVCSTCGAYGDDAHTITYCPVLRSNNNGQPLPSTTITLKNTRIKSNGRRRY